MIFELYPNIFRVVPEIFTSSIQIISILLHDKLLKIRRYFIFLWFKIVDFTDRLLIDNLIMRCPSSVQQCKKRNKSVDDVIRNTFSCFMSTTWEIACLTIYSSSIPNSKWRPCMLPYMRNHPIVAHFYVNKPLKHEFSKYNFSFLTSWPELSSN